MPVLKGVKDINNRISTLSCHRVMRYLLCMMGTSSTLLCLPPICLWLKITLFFVAQNDRANCDYNISKKILFKNNGVDFIYSINASFAWVTKFSVNTVF